MRFLTRSHPIDTRVGLWRRLASIAYDLVLVTALLMVLTGLVLVARRGSAFDPQSLWFRIALLTSWWAYFAWSWTRGGQTVGCVGNGHDGSHGRYLPTWT